MLPLEHYSDRLAARPRSNAASATRNHTLPNCDWTLLLRRGNGVDLEIPNVDHATLLYTTSNRCVGFRWSNEQLLHIIIIYFVFVSLELHSQYVLASSTWRHYPDTQSILKTSKRIRWLNITLMTKMRAVGWVLVRCASCRRHLNGLMMSEVSFVGLSFQLLNGNYALCIIVQKDA